MTNVLSFLPVPGKSWFQVEMKLMVDYIQHIRNIGNLKSPYHKTKEEFEHLAQEFKEQVHEMYNRGELHQTVLIFDTYDAERPTWEIPLTEVGLSVWNNVNEQWGPGS